MKPIGLDGFADKFANSNDPWGTFTNRDESVKRMAILHALGPGPIGRVLELASGNGSNSRAIAPRALRLDATEGTSEGTRLTAEAIRDFPRSKAIELALPAPFPTAQYDAIIIAELLYYLSPGDMARLADDVRKALRPGGQLVLAHHRIDFYDFAQHARDIHSRFLQRPQASWSLRRVRVCARWEVVTATKLSRAE